MEVTTSKSAVIAASEKIDKILEKRAASEKKVAGDLAADAAAPQIVNRVEEVKAIMKKLVEKKAAEIVSIEKELSNATDKKNKATQALSNAIAATDRAAYKKAKAEAEEAATIIEMYAARLDQLRNKEFMSEEESDRVVDSLIEYQNKRTAAFIKAIAGPIGQIEELYIEYDRDYQAAVETVAAWTRDIHKNYRSLCTTFADGSHRSKTPRPVVGAAGFFPDICKEAIEVRDFIEEFKGPHEVYE